MSIHRFEPYTGSDLATTRLNRCGAEYPLDGEKCDLVDEHGGMHVIVSGAGLVLEAWGSEDSVGGIDSRTRECIEALARIDADVREALNEAEYEILALGRKYRDSPILTELIDDADVPSFDGIGLPEGEKHWPRELELIRQRIERRKGKAA